MKFNIFIWLVGSIAAETVADIACMQYIHSPNWRTWTMAGIWYCLVWIAWLVAMKNGLTLSRGASLFWILSSLLAVLIGVWYGEHLTIRNWIGLLFGIISIACLV